MGLHAAAQCDSSKCITLERFTLSHVHAVNSVEMLILIAWYVD